jgi:hypothetical protein
MPPVNQGSRSALVTWTVVTTILFVTATIIAIYSFVDANDVRAKANTTATTYRQVVSEAALSSPQLEELRSARENTEAGYNSSMTLLDVALKQRDDLARAITGSPNFNLAMQELRRLRGKVPAQVEAAEVRGLPEPIGAALATLADQIVARQTEINDLRDQLKQAQDAQRAAAEQLATVRTALDEQLTAIRSETAAVVSASEAERTAKDEQIRQITADFQAQLDQAQASLQQSQVQVADLQRSLEQVRGEITARNRDRGGGEQPDTNGPMLRQADGRIVRIPGGDVVYIDVGAGDQVTPGLTFQVYDKTTGVPPPGDPQSDENLPKGKASIEVVRVGPTSSECRVIRVQPGQALTEGDLIANVVYDRNTKYNFMVFGNFDLDRNGVATPQDADVIRRLVTQWGGALSDRVNVNTDFVVLGAEPVIPSFTREELQDPLNQAKFDEARAAADAYEEVRRLAQEYNVPILNQNRFLYFVGFFELSRR